MVSFQTDIFKMDRINCMDIIFKEIKKVRLLIFVFLILKIKFIDSNYRNLYLIRMHINK